MFIKKLLPTLLENAEAYGLEKASSFQKQLISGLKSGKDFIAKAPPASGKQTAALLAILHVLKEEEGDTPRALWLCKSDAEIETLQEMHEHLGKNLTVRMIVAPDGKDILKQKDEIYFGSDLVVTTPKRANELLSIEGINMISMRHLLISDGEKLIKNEVKTLCYRVSESMPKAQKIVLTKEMTVNIERYSEQFMKLPSIVRHPVNPPHI